MWKTEFGEWLTVERNVFRERGCSRLDEVVFHMCGGHISTVNLIKSRITSILVGLCARMWGNIFIMLRWEDPSTVGGTIP